MKKQLLIAAIIIFTACNKNDDTNSKSRAEHLTNGKWFFYSIEIHETGPNGYDTTYDFLAGSENCDLDDYYEFYNDRKFVFDEGVSKCDASNPQKILEGTWKLNDNDAKLIFITGANGFSFDDTVTIITLNDNSLITTKSSSYLDTLGNSINFTVKNAAKHQ